MIYVMGDIHGCFSKYKEMLKKIRMNENDSLFVLGDIIDVGKDGIKILNDMMYRTNIYPILGEHEYMAKKLLPQMLSAKDLEQGKAMVANEDKELLETWLKSSSESTIADFFLLDIESREGIIDYLSEFEPYEELEASDRNFVLVHSGIRNFEVGKPLDEYDEEDFVFAGTDYKKVYYPDRFMITGHIPTVAIDPQGGGKVYSKKKHIALDCGAAYDGRLACICLDNLKVYYC